MLACYFRFNETRLRGIRHSEPLNKGVLMLKKILLCSLSIFFYGNFAHASNCIDFKTCTAVMFDLTGQRYVWGNNFDTAKIGASPAVELTKENAELIFTALLDQAGYTRMPVGDGKTYRIVRSVERKEMELPIVEASAEHMPNFPNTWDWIMMRYKVKSPELAAYLERAYRLHVPRDSRLQADENTGTIIVTAATPIVRQMYETLKGADKPLTANLKEKIKAEGKRRHEVELAKLKCPQKD